MTLRKKYIIIFSIVIGVLAIDLITKQAFNDISYTKIIPYLIAFQTNGGNTGAAFGIFSKSTTFLIASSVVIVLALAVVDIMLKATSKTYCIGFGLILGGAIGNFIDRTALGYVRDFIMLDFWHSFPIFNFADCCIVIGTILMCVHFIFLSKAGKNENSK